MELLQTELQVCFDAVVDSIDRLYRLAAQIRRPATRSGLSDQDHYNHIPQEERRALLNQMAEIERRRLEEVLRDIRRPANNKEIPLAFDGNPVSDHLSVQLQESDMLLLDRLQRANNQRRRRFFRWRSQRHGRESGGGEDVDAETSVMGTLPDIGLSKPRHAGITRLRIDSSDQSVLTPSGASFSRLDPAKFDRQASLSGMTNASWTTSARSLPEDKLNWPDPPKLEAKVKNFECPFCFMLCPRQYQRKVEWR